jgi:hypothetical protein
MAVPGISLRPAMTKTAKVVGIGCIALLLIGVLRKVTQ